MAWWDRGTAWFSARARGAYARTWLIVLSFTESSVFIFPPDPLLVGILLVAGERWIYYAVITTLASIAGAVFGYVLGAFFFDTIGESLITLYNLGVHVDTVRTLFSTNAFWVLFTAAFTPIPFKIFVLLAGFVRINFFVFLIATIFGRGLRYGMLAYLTHVFGSKALALANRYSLITTLCIVAAVSAYIVFKFFY